jgi:hypothetical protein
LEELVDVPDDTEHVRMQEVADVVSLALAGFSELDLGFGKSGFGLIKRRREGGKERRARVSSRSDVID